MMSKIKDVVDSIPGVRIWGGCSQKDIRESERALGLRFPKEYKEYLLLYGSITFRGTELCGLNIPGHLNVVNATNQEKSVNPYFPDKMFVIENLGIDARLAICDERGTIYLLQRTQKVPVAKSLSEYLMKIVDTTDFNKDRGTGADSHTKVYDKAKWHIDAGEDTKGVFDRFKKVFSFLKSRNMLTPEGLEQIEIGIDSEAVLHSRMLTRVGQLFLDANYDAILKCPISSISSELKKRMRSPIVR